jgi:N6-L-threonylcarbamoyladenine synthase
VAVAGGVSANSGLRDAVGELGRKQGWKVFFPDRSYTTDNAAMIALAGYHKFLNNQFSDHSVVPAARFDQF